MPVSPGWRPHFFCLAKRNWGKEKATTCRFNPQFIITIGRSRTHPDQPQNRGWLRSSNMRLPKTPNLYNKFRRVSSGLKTKNLA